MDYKEQFSVDCYYSLMKVGGPDLIENYIVTFSKSLTTDLAILALQILD